MPTRLRNKYLANALEAILRYAEDGDVLHYDSDADAPNALLITFEIGDDKRYQRILSEVMAEGAGTAQGDPRTKRYLEA